MGYYDNDTMEALVGKTISAIRVEAGENRLAFLTTGGDVIAYEAAGDCCSESWFADITGVDALILGTVAKAEMIDMPEPTDGRTRQEYDSAYGIKLTTEKGIADIVFRNSSNGYYGGWITRDDNVTTVTDVASWKPILDDWSAQ